MARNLIFDVYLCRKEVPGSKVRTKQQWIAVERGFLDPPKPPEPAESIQYVLRNILAPNKAEAISEACRIRKLPKR